jgi:hypothetical protein
MTFSIQPEDTCGVIEQILREHTDIIAVSVRLFPPPPLFEKRFQPTPTDEDLIAKALQVRNDVPLPFPDAIAVVACEKPRPSPEYLAAIDLHNELGPARWINRDEIVIGGLRRLIENSDARCYTAISSAVRLKIGGTRHLPMLDFHIRPSDDSVYIIENTLDQIAPTNGWILESGGSYHFIGDSPVRRTNLVKFLARALLYSPITDRTWISHQIYEGSCTLRISNNPRSGAGAPKVVSRASALMRISPPALDRKSPD